MKYMLDTDTCIDVLRGRETSAPENIMKHEIGSISLSAITHYELVFGLHKVNSKKKWEKFKSFTRNLVILPFNDIDSDKAALIRADLEGQGKGIGELDTLIAGHSLSRALTLVTSNTKHFKRIKKLKIENWR